MTLRLLNWNVEWARPDAKKSGAIRERIAAENADVICLTEVDPDFLAGDGYLVSSEANYGYASKSWRRKVVLWSTNPWTEVDSVGSELLPTGRFVSAVTETHLGPIRFIGICIPYRFAHVSYGRGDRKTWDEHITYLHGLSDILNRVESATLVVGDFNQKVPRTIAPFRAFEALVQTFDGLTIATTGPIMNINKPTIDHVAHTDDLVATEVHSIDNTTLTGPRLSDHFGVVVDFTSSGSRQS